MKLVVVSIITGILFTVPGGQANAAPVDCEAARCTIQATIDAECPCADAKNHGRYTSCVARVVQRAAHERLIPRKCRNKINGCYIRSTCGKREGAILCDFPGDGVGGRCRPLSSDSTCTGRGGTVVASCCDTCGAPEPTATPEGPVATATEGPVATATEGPIATSTPETPEPTPTEGPLATATEGPVATATPEGPVETPTEGPLATATEGPVATATPEGPVETPTEGPLATATEGPVATATEGPVATSTPEEPVPTPTSTPEGATCGDGIVNGTEQCDTAAPPPQCPDSGGALQTCALGCVCPCPGTVAFTGDALSPDSVLDTGFTGIAHRAPIITNGDVTVDLNCAATSRPCGTCAVTGPIVNAQAGAGKLDNRRCTSDPSLKCAVDATCTAAQSKCSGGTNNEAACLVTSCAMPGACTAGTCVGGADAGKTCCNGGFCRPAGTCGFYFGSPLALAAGGVSTCVVNSFKQPITGTANVETGDAATTAFLTSRVYNGLTVDSPCPTCSDQGGFNDGVNGGTCDAGPHQGFACDANGEVGNRPDFGRTSLDCPPLQAGIIATLTVDLSSRTGAVIKTLSASSPTCANAPGNRCLCETCNSGAAELCDDNSDCPDPPGTIYGPICGGKRCIGGTNLGAACLANSECPGAQLACSKVGEPTKPTGCIDETTINGFPNNHFDCSDPDGDGIGECEAGPNDPECTVASGHAQRSCSIDTEVTDCGAPGTCISHPRRCFLTGGGTTSSQPGSNTLIAEGMADAPINDVSHPTLASVFCIAPTTSASINNVAGLPGPARVTINGTATGLP